MNKIKKISHNGLLMLFCILSLPLAVRPQVVITAQLPAAGMLYKEQLWNLSLFNNNDRMEVTLKLILQDALTGQTVMSANTGAVILNKGIRVLTNSDVQPVIYNTGTALQQNFLPMGSYIVCYQINTMRGDLQEPVSSECTKINIEPLSPPLLSFPSDKSKLSTPYPVFAWMPPTPVNMFYNLSYDIMVTEVLEGQSPVDAMEKNTPVYAVNHLTKTNENYPASFTKLNPAKVYAWQVLARNSDRYAVKTDVWTFTINKEMPPVAQPSNENYLLIENNLNDRYLISNKQLHIKYTSFDKEHEALINFSNEKGVNVISIRKKISQGDNYFDVKLNNHFEKGRTYNVTITDLSGNGKALLFSIK